MCMWCVAWWDDGCGWEAWAWWGLDADVGRWSGGSVFGDGCATPDSPRRWRTPSCWTDGPSCASQPSWAWTCPGSTSSCTALRRCAVRAGTAVSGVGRSCWRPSTLPRPLPLAAHFHPFHVVPLPHAPTPPLDLHNWIRSRVERELPIPKDPEEYRLMVRPWGRGLMGKGTEAVACGGCARPGAGSVNALCRARDLVRSCRTPRAPQGRR
jgi:hypothetical protein